MLEGENSILKNVINEINLLKNNGSNIEIKIHKIEDIYGYYEPTIIPKGKIKTENIIYSDYKNKLINNIHDIKDLLEMSNGKITKIRKDKGFIKATPNNEFSSRSHLFITLKITNGEKVGYLTLVDMAGIEDPMDLTYTIIPTIDPAAIFYSVDEVKYFLKRMMQTKNTKNK